jgi:hypothetical protein
MSDDERPPAPVVDLIQWKRERGRHETIYLCELLEDEGAMDQVVAVGCEDGERRVGLTFPRAPDGRERFDGFAFTPEEARRIGIALIECAGALLGNEWLDRGE